MGTWCRLGPWLLNTFSANKFAAKQIENKKKTNWRTCKKWILFYYFSWIFRFHCFLFVFGLCIFLIFFVIWYILYIHKHVRLFLFLFYFEFANFFFLVWGWDRIWRFSNRILTGPWTWREYYTNAELKALQHLGNISARLGLPMQPPGSEISDTWFNSWSVVFLFFIYGLFCFCLCLSLLHFIF